MPTVSVDGRGVLIDGRRRWLVSGTIDPARIPHELWPARLESAVAAGLNTVTVPVAWAVHEPLPGQFSFDGDRDIAAFVRQAAALGLMVVLRPGPFLGSGWDRGGIPAWVDPGTDDTGRSLALRSSAPAFLQAAATWIGRLAEQLRALQATEGGPIVLVQNEHRWFCGDEQHAGAYLGELARYLRENGFNLPLVNTNNLYASAEGEIQGWNGHRDLLAAFRQLRTVRPDQPGLAWDLEIGRTRTWNGSDHAVMPPAEALDALAQATAAGAQCNLGPFAGGTNFAFLGGRLPFARDAFVTQSADDGAPLSEAGRPTDLLDALRPLLMFSSSFERLLATADWSSPPACLSPGQHATTVVHASGDAGAVVLVLRDPASPPKRTEQVQRVLLPDGRELSVDLKDRPVVWCVLDAAIDRTTRLDHASASVMWTTGKSLALTAPAGSAVSLSINGSALEMVAPRGKKPEIIEHEGVTVALLSTAQAAACAVTRDGLLLGAERAGVPRAGSKSWTLLARNGAVTTGVWGSTTKRTTRRTLTGWAAAPADAFVLGESERYAVIDGPQDLEALGALYGYGWLRATFRAPKAGKRHSALSESGDRVHIFANGTAAGVVGIGPGATDGALPLPLRKGVNVVTLLADNLGRPSGGWSERQRKGVWGPIYEIAPLKTAKPELVTGERLHPLAFRSPLTRLHADDVTHASRVTWTFTHRRKTPIVLRLGERHAGLQGILIVNGVPIDAVDEASRGVFVLRDELRNGSNTVQLAVVSDPGAALRALAPGTRLEECVADLTADAEWAFARWEQPEDRLFTEVEKSHTANGQPVWRRASFKTGVITEPLALDCKGLTKGQLYLNGRNLGRYFHADSTGKPVTGQRGVYLPESWLNENGANELVVFDEHGASAERCRIVDLASMRR